MAGSHKIELNRVALVSSKRPNTLKQHHLLVTRSRDGFRWEIRYGRNARPALWSDTPFLSQQEAKTAGEQALREFAPVHDPVDSQERQGG